MRDDNDDVSRRTFMKAASLTAAAGVVGASANGDAAHGGFHSEFANWRVREAEKVWDRGYRGRADRTLGLTDSGVDARHPDLGPWNGVRVVNDADGSIRLIDWEDVPEEDLSGPNDYEFRIDRQVDDGWEAVGTREDDGSVFTGGQTNGVTVTLEDVIEVDRVRVTDRIPDGWRLLEDYGDATGSDGVVDFGEVDVASLADGDAAFTYFVEAPNGLEHTAAYEFGPARVEVVEGGEDVRNEEAEFTGTRTVAVVGQDTGV